MFLTSQYTNQVRKVFLLDLFTKEISVKKELDAQIQSLKESDPSQIQHLLSLNLESILNQHYCPSAVECLNLKNVKLLLFISVLVYFKLKLIFANLNFTQNNN